MSQFSEWLMQQFVAWEQQMPRRQSYSAFARYLEVNQSSFSQWMAGNYVPTGENLQKIATKLGYEIYNVLGERPIQVYAVPDMDLAYIVSIWERLDPSDRQLILQMIKTRLPE